MVLETTQLPEVVLVSECGYVHGVHTMAPNSMAIVRVHVKIACIDNTPEHDLSVVEWCIRSYTKPIMCKTSRQESRLVHVAGCM